MKAKIHLQKIKVMTLIGVRSYEKKIKQPLIIDVCFELDINEAQSDDNLNSTIDYSNFTQKIIEYVQSSSFHLLETLVTHLADYLLSSFPLLSVQLKIHKPHALKDLADVSIEYFKEACVLSSPFSNILQEGGKLGG